MKKKYQTKIKLFYLKKDFKKLFVLVQKQSCLSCFIQNLLKIKIQCSYMFLAIIKKTMYFMHIFITSTVLTKTKTKILIRRVLV